MSDLNYQSELTLFIINLLIESFFTMCLKQQPFWLIMLHVWLLTKDEMGDLETFKPFTHEKQLEVYVVSELNFIFWLCTVFLEYNLHVTQVKMDVAASAS